MNAKKLVAAALLLAACTGKYIRPTTDEKVEATAERLARGEYLVNSVGACGGCHSGREGGDNLHAFINSGESTEKYLAGGIGDTVPEMGATLFMPNLTSDEETGLGTWTDDEIMRAIRDGIGKDGRLLFPMMPFNSYQHMSDEDVRSIVAYLRSIPKVKTKSGKSEMGGFVGFLLRRGVAHHLPATNVPPPDKSNQVKYGEYVMRLGHCWECHAATSDGMPRQEDDPLWMAGGRVEELPGLGKVPIRNLTPDKETGLGNYTAEQIKQAMRTGTRLDGKKMAPPMSLYISHWSTMTDEDLDALVSYLQSLKPAKNAIPERELSEEWKKKLGET
ncbi:MAG: c-type cytochrome [Myxococcota bacterium]